MISLNLNAAEAQELQKLTETADLENSDFLSLVNKARLAGVEAHRGNQPSIVLSEPELDEMLLLLPTVAWENGDFLSLQSKAINAKPAA